MNRVKNAANCSEHTVYPFAGIITFSEKDIQPEKKGGWICGDWRVAGSSHRTLPVSISGKVIISFTSRRISYPCCQPVYLNLYIATLVNELLFLLSSQRVVVWNSPTGKCHTSVDT